MNKALKTHNRAFTLLEMLLVIAIIAILAGIVIVAINPGRQLAQARNAQRESDLRAIHSAVQQYYIDNKSWPTTTLSGTLQEICDEDGQPSDSCLDLTDALVPTYLSAIPRDPQASVGTNYHIAINSNSNTPELTAPSSTEYSLEPVQLGTEILNYNNVVLNFTATSESISYNASATLDWNVENADTCTASGDWSSSISMSGSETFDNLTSSKSYTLECSNQYHTTTQTININVANAVSYTLYYDDNSGGTFMSEPRLEYSTAALTLSEPTSTGYTFLNWNIEIDNSGASYNPGDSFTMPSNDVTLYAIWSINQYTLTFNTNGGSSISPITQNYNTAITSPADPTKSGYTFNGWSPTIPSTMPANNETHTALWEAMVSCDPIVDTRDGKTYATVQIGTQCWMQQNLNVGTMITYFSNMANNSILEKYCYGNLESNCTTYGGLYQWDEAMQYVTTIGAQGICPTGWHIPTHDEFTTFERSICTSGSCTTDFPYDNTTTGRRGTNEGTTMKDMSGIWKGFLTGRRSDAGSMAGMGVSAYYWTSLQSGTSAWYRYMKGNYTDVDRTTLPKLNGFPLRCLKN